MAFSRYLDSFRERASPCSLRITNLKVTFGTSSEWLKTCRGPNTHPKSRNTKKTPRLHELFRKVRANFSLLSCDTSQEPNRNCSNKLVQMNVFYFGWIFSGGFSAFEKVTPERTLSLPAAKILSPVARQAPTKPQKWLFGGVKKSLVVALLNHFGGSPDNHFLSHLQFFRAHRVLFVSGSRNH